MHRYILLVALIGISPVVVLGQQTLIYSEPDATFSKAMQLFEAQKYSAAEHLFEAASRETAPLQSAAKIDADYYAAVCSMYLFHDDALRRMTNFVTMHPQSPRVKKIDFLLGNYLYRKQRFKEALKWYSKVDPSFLDTAEISEFYFKRGYSYFSHDLPDSAKYDFAQVKEGHSKYSPEAMYYYSYIAYRQKNYQTAVTGFLSLVNDPHFGRAVPYYITELYYLQGNYGQAVQFAIPLMDSAKSQTSMLNAEEIIKLIAESYYRLHKYKEDIPFFLMYANGIVAPRMMRKAGDSAYREYDNSSSLPEQESYELGYSYFATSQYKQAIPWFQKATYSSDSMSQNALYYLAVSYLKMGNKAFASNAFGEVCKMNYFPNLKEDALFNYAKLAYELSFDPFDEAIKAFNQYIHDYPNSAHKEEAYRYLVNIYQSTKNYPAAIASLQKIKNWDAELQAVYQKLTYYWAVDLFNNGKMEQAITYFENSLKYDYEQKTHLLAYYWKAEALYREKKYEDAIEAFKLFMVQPEAYSTPEYNKSEYGIGYSYFEDKNYDYSNLYFRKYTTAETSDKKRLCDACNRLGDGYFIQRDFASAIPWYDECVQLNVYDMDYASYQKALAQGVLHKLDDKISTLEAFMKQYPKSNYRPAAMMELANTYAINNQPMPAVDEYQQVIDNYPNSPYITQCLLQKGQIYYNQNQADKAKQAWEEVVQRNRNSPEGAEALSHIKMLYTSQGQIQKMQDYFHQVGADLSTQAIDSATFSVVKTNFQNNDYPKTLTAANAYIQKFPQGIFSAEAHFYRGECYYRQKKADSALADYAYVIKMQSNFFTESALTKASQLAFEKKDYSAALDYYNRLGANSQYAVDLSLARTGKMHCNYLLKNYDAAISAADSVLKTTKMQNDVYAEATMIIAKSLFKKEQYDSSLAYFQKVTAMTHSEMEAEAKYNVAYIEYLKTDIPESEKTIFDLVNQEPSYPLWMAKGLILLSDDYLAVHDNFQAKHTLHTVIDNASDTAIVRDAKHRLDLINENEKKAIPAQVSPTMTIPFSNDSTEYEKLFKN